MNAGYICSCRQQNRNSCTGSNSSRQVSDWSAVGGHQISHSSPTADHRTAAHQHARTHKYTHTQADARASSSDASFAILTRWHDTSRCYWKVDLNENSPCVDYGKWRKLILSTRVSCLFRSVRVDFAADWNINSANACNYSYSINTVNVRISFITGYILKCLSPVPGRCHSKIYNRFLGINAVFLPENAKPKFHSTSSFETILFRFEVCLVEEFSSSRIRQKRLIHYF